MRNAQIHTVYVLLQIGLICVSGKIHRDQQNKHDEIRSSNLRNGRTPNFKLEGKDEEFSTTIASEDVDIASLFGNDGNHGERGLASSEICLPFGTSCTSSSSNCCQGGCSSSKTCFCQAPSGMCFNRGGKDAFCCSNRCGSNGRCECIKEGKSCAAGDFCCNGLKCGSGGTCVSESSTEPETTYMPTTKPTAKPTSKPSDELARSPSTPGIMQSEFNNNCQANGGLCFNSGGEDFFCCSNFCGSNGRCKCLSAGKSCANGDYCCNGLTCGSDGICAAETTGSTIASSTTTTTTATSMTIATTAPTNKPTTMPTNEPTHNPTSVPTQKPTSLPTKEPTPSPIQEVMEPRTNLCSSGTIKLTIEIQTDQYGSDTSWFVAKSHRSNAPIIKVDQGTYNATEYDKRETCIEPGTTLNFTVYDSWGDGLCCAYGNGYVKAYLDDREIMHVTSFGKNMSEIINVGFDATPNMTTRELLYLEAHNTRRKEWHESNNVTYVPLSWSPKIAEEARVWAEELLVNCSSSGIEHEHGVVEGENLAKNVGNPSTWGQLYPANNIVGRWVDWEVKRPYPGNAHLTQALWRASKYIGCGESVKDFANGKCRVQVCRYARAGNCDMARYNATSGKNWLAPMLAETSRCGPTCPPEGCF